LKKTEEKHQIWLLQNLVQSTVANFKKKSLPNLTGGVIIVLCSSSDGG